MQQVWSAGQNLSAWMSHGRIDTFHKGCYHTTTTVATNLVIIHVCVWVCAHVQRCVYVGVVLEGQMGVYF